MIVGPDKVMVVQIRHYRYRLLSSTWVCVRQWQFEAPYRLTHGFGILLQSLHCSRNKSANETITMFSQSHSKGHVSSICCRYHRHQEQVQLSSKLTPISRL